MTFTIEELENIATESDRVAETFHAAGDRVSEVRLRQFGSEARALASYIRGDLSQMRTESHVISVKRHLSALRGDTAGAVERLDSFTE